MMAFASETDTLLIGRIRDGDSDAWTELISRFEGRLLAFVESRIGRRAASEDVVQETFIGFLTSLPNYDESRALESYLFSIAAHKMTDHLRREGRRPTLPLAISESQGDREVPDRQRAVSSAVRSGERRSIETESLATAIAEQIETWRKKNEWTKIQCVELLLVRGMINKHVAARLDISEQQVANFKFDFLARLRKAVRRQSLSRDIFPELYETP